MAEVITRLKVDNAGFDQKIKNAQRSLDQFGLKGTALGNKMSGLTNLFNVNLASISKWSVGLGAASAAIKVAGDAFKQNEVLMDGWNGTIEGAKGVYDSFLNSLNTGDFTGFFSRMGKVAAAARAAYDALDELGTFNAFNQIQMAGAQTGLNEALAGYRSGALGKSDVEAAANELKKELGTRQKLEQDAYEAAIKKLAAERNVGFEDLKNVLAGEYGDYEALKNTEMTGKKVSYHSAGQFGGMYTVEEAIPANDLERLGEMLRKLTDDELQNLQALGAKAQQTANEIANVDKQTAKIFKEKPSSASASSKPNSTSALGELGLLEDYRKTIVASMQFAETADDLEPMQEELNRVDQKIVMIKDHLMEVGKAMRNFDVKAPADFAQVAGNASKVLKDTVSKTAKTAVQTASSWEIAASAVGQLGSALQNTGNESLNVAGIIAQAVANVALGLGEALSTKNHETAGPWDWIAAAISGTATMIGTIAAIRQATEYHADGGIVGMNSLKRGTDVVPAMLTPGEVVLSRSQTSNLANQLQSSGGSSSPYVSGEMIYLGLNNYLKRTGRGEIITSR